MLVRRYLWMGMISLILTLLLLSDSLMVRATEFGTLTGDGTNENAEQYIVDDDEIWALIDRDELRSLVDVDLLKYEMDLDAIRSQIDEEPLLEQISNVSLLGSLSSEEILGEYNALKESGELDEVIRDVIESEGFNEEYIRNHPVDVPNVTVPIVNGESPLDYIADPMGLLYLTDAAKYGGGSVQEGATLLFKNTDGAYLFSDTSDMLEIVNRGNVPLQVTISARIENDGYVRMVDSISMLEGIEPSMFMALIGEDGILSVLNETGSSEISLVLDAVPDGTYNFTFNEETGRYDSEMTENADVSQFDRFVFGVTGECNTDADWIGVDDLPRITVTWKTEPILTDWDKINEELEEADRVKFEAYKKVKLEELREAELERLIQIQIDDMIYEELDRMIDEEVERLAQFRFEELKELAIRGELDLESGVPGDSAGMLIMDEEDEADGDADSEDADGSAADEPEKKDGEVLGATRERIEFAESEGGDDTIVYGEASRDEVPQDDEVVEYSGGDVAGEPKDEAIDTFDSEDDEVQETVVDFHEQEQAEDPVSEDEESENAESGGSSDSVIFF